jgi:phosphoribosylaminoimidazole-succinocarboxamide synthase
VRKAKALPVECVVRGYITGSLWSAYKRGEKVCGIGLPAGLQESEKLPEPVFTPTTKATSGHDENITFEQVCGLVGKDIANLLRETSIRIYEGACAKAEKNGIIIADTKFEFGMLGGEVIIIDEMLTPDSSRFWPAGEYAVGKSQPSFDKQYVRDYLESIKWDKKPPAPQLPADIVEETSRKYLEAYKRLTGKELED